MTRSSHTNLFHLCPVPCNLCILVWSVLHHPPPLRPQHKLQSRRPEMCHTPLLVFFSCCIWSICPGAYCIFFSLSLAFLLEFCVCHLGLSPSCLSPSPSPSIKGVSLQSPRVVQLQNVLTALLGYFYHLKNICTYCPAEYYNYTWYLTNHIRKGAL